MRRIVLGLAGLIIFLLCWESIRWSGLVSDRLVAFPSTFAAFIAHYQTLPGLKEAAAISGALFVWGFLLAGILGTVLGVVFGWYHRAGHILDPLFVALNAVPLIALIPLLIVTMGLGAATEITVVGTFAFFPVYFAVNSALAAVDSNLVRMSRSFGGNEWQILRSIALPTILPAIIAGLRLGVGRALTGLVVVELFIGRGGVGSFMYDAINQGNPNAALLVVLGLAVVNIAVSAVLQVIQTQLERWRPAQAGI